MKKVIVFQHVAHSILGTLNPEMKSRGLRIRYVNFERQPDFQTDIDHYHALVVLGGFMGVYESERYHHIKTECRLIENAMKQNKPVLGICLGSQLIAHVLGSKVYKNQVKEIGWMDIHLTEDGKSDPVLKHFQAKEKIFQMHGDTFDLPKDCIHLAKSKDCPQQAFRYGENVYGLQFHLEVDKAMIERWLLHPQNLLDINNSNGLYTTEKIVEETHLYLPNSLDLSKKTFQEFLNLFSEKQRKFLLGSDHAMPDKKSR